jgi:hypothetical protein
MTSQTAIGAELRHEIGATGRLTLRVPSGDVRIVGTDSTEAIVRERNGHDLAERFEIGRGAGSLELVSKPHFGFKISIDNHVWGRGAPSLDIQLPAGAEVTIQSASAEISTTGLLGPKELRTASGDLVLEATGGKLDLDSVSGDVRIEASAALDLRAKTISGDVRVRAPRVTRFELATTSGDVRLDAELAGAGPFSIKSISGDVVLVSRGSFQVEAQSITGDLVSEVAHRRESFPGKKLLSVGRSGPTLAFKSVSGDLHLVEAREQQVTAMTDDTETTTTTPTSASEPAETARLEILRALERGDIDVDTATERLAALEKA